MKREISYRSVFSKEMIMDNVNFAIVLFGVILVSLIWIGFTLKVCNEEQLEINNSIKIADNLARAFEEHTLRTIKSSDQVALFVKNYYEKNGLGDIGLFLKQAVTEQPYILVSLADENGNLIASSQDTFVFSNIKDREHFKIHEMVELGQMFVGKPVLGRSSGKWSIQMTRRINKPDGNFAGVVVVSVDPNYFTNFYDEVDLGKNSSIGLIGTDGIIRAGQSCHIPFTGQDLNQVNSQLMKEIAIKNSGHYTAVNSVDGIKRYYAFRSLPEYELIVTVGIAESVILAEFYEREKSYIIVALLLSLFVAGYCVFLIRMQMFAQGFSRLERLNLIGEMAAGIGHEIRNPMTTVRGFLQFLGNKPKYADDKEYFDNMIDELDRANSIITEYLSLAKGRAIEREKIDLNLIIRKLFPLIQSDAVLRNIDIDTNLEKIPELLLDDKEIRQLILNIARNGLEAMPVGGKLTIRTFSENSEVVMSIQDEGKGIEQQVLDKIGNPFFTTKDYGTGLGLAVCSSIAQRHNASIHVETSPMGTTFSVRFRLEE